MSRGKGQRATVPKARGLGPSERGRCAHIFCSHRSSGCRRWHEERGQLFGADVGRRQVPRLGGLFDALRLGHLDLRRTRPAASAGPPPATAVRPLTPAIEKLGEWPPRTPPNPKKDGCRIALYKADDGLMRSAFENQSQRYPLTGVAMQRCRVTGVAVNNQMTLPNMWGRPSRAWIPQPLRLLLAVGTRYPRPRALISPLACASHEASICKCLRCACLILHF